MEQKQREDDAYAIQGKAKGKGGRPQVKKLQHQETLPSPHERRVIPTITSAMKAEATKKIKKKIKVVKGFQKILTNSS